MRLPPLSVPPRPTELPFLIIVEHVKRLLFYRAIYLPFLESFFFSFRFSLQKSFEQEYSSTIRNRISKEIFEEKLYV